MQIVPQINPSISLEDYNQNFASFIQQIQHSGIQYASIYFSLLSQIKPQKCLSNDVPSLEEIKQKYQIFLHR